MPRRPTPMKLPRNKRRRSSKSRATILLLGCFCACLWLGVIVVFMLTLNTSLTPSPAPAASAVAAQGEAANIAAANTVFAEEERTLRAALAERDTSIRALEAKLRLQGKVGKAAGAAAAVAAVAPVAAPLGAAAPHRPATGFPVQHHHRFPDGDRAIRMCNAALWNTVASTTKILDDGTTFVFTGDIDDLWLRDSAAQVHLYIPMAAADPDVSATSRSVRRLVSGLIRRHAFYIRHDPYANAFRIDTRYKFSAEQKAMGRHDYISTWNYELDSGCYFLRMLHTYWTVVPDDPVLRLPAVREAAEIMIEVWRAEQRHEEDGVATGPLLDCQNCGRPYRYAAGDSRLPRNGKGGPTARTGMTWTGFRPSDDACQYHYLVPANMFAVVALGQLAAMAPVLWGKAGTALAASAQDLAAEIDAGIQRHGIVRHPKHGRIYAYEVDGLGNSLLMDDANVPSLLSAPYLGYKVDPKVYANTRAFILSRDNPTYAESRNGRIKGYGSPHMGQRIRNNIWPMAQAIQGLTSSSKEEKLDMVRMLTSTDGGTGHMHESYDPDQPRKFTRKWFCWADALFAELVMSLTDQCPATKMPPLPRSIPTDPLVGPGRVL